MLNLKRKVNAYKEVLKNTTEYRQAWKDHLKSLIISGLEKMVAAVELGAKVESRGMYHEVNSDIKRHLIKHKGSLIYQQLFNGKILALVNYPYIENYGEPRPPKTIGIYRPEELTPPFFIRHFEDFITEITNWEDYDDDEPGKKIGFDMNFGSPMTQKPTMERDLD